MISFPRIITIAGALGSEALMLFVGRRNPSKPLLAIFTVWVLSPFALLLLANARAGLHTLTVIIAVSSLVAYGIVAFGPPQAKPAATFVFVPPISCLLVGGALLADRRSRRSRDVTK
jgi:CDP-diglyceride synthetase